MGVAIAIYFPGGFFAVGCWLFFGNRWEKSAVSCKALPQFLLKVSRIFLDSTFFPGAEDIFWKHVEKHSLPKVSNAWCRKLLGELPTENPVSQTGNEDVHCHCGCVCFKYGIKQKDAERKKKQNSWTPPISKKHKETVTPGRWTAGTWE